MFIPLSHPPPTTPLERFVRIIDGLCAAVAARGAGGALTVPLFFLLWRRLRHTATRAIKAAAGLAAGIPQAAPRPQAPRPYRPQPLRLPRGFAWVVRVVPGTAVYAGQLQALLADPRMAPLCEAPSMRRLLNPLRQMLGVPARAFRPPRRPAFARPKPSITDHRSVKKWAGVAPPPPPAPVAA